MSLESRVMITLRQSNFYVDLRNKKVNNTITSAFHIVGVKVMDTPRNKLSIKLSCQIYVKILWCFDVTLYFDDFLLIYTMHENHVKLNYILLLYA